MQLLVPGNHHETSVFSVKDVPADIFISRCAKHLKDSGLFEIPEWAEFAKSGCSKELSPYDDDFFFIRSASILRKMAMDPKRCGVGTLSNYYGAVQNNGSAPSHHRNGSRKVIRYCIQQLQKMNLVEAWDTQDHRNRKLSSQGQACVDQIAKRCNN